MTADGFENQMATNYIGHFALSGLLMPLLTGTRDSRVVTLSSLSYKWAEIDFDDLQARNGYSKRKAYGQSKRACLMFAYALQRRLSAVGHQAISVTAHPGLSKTNLDRYFPALIRPLAEKSKPVNGSSLECTNPDRSPWHSNCCGLSFYDPCFINGCCFDFKKQIWL